MRVVQWNRRSLGCLFVLLFLLTNPGKSPKPDSYGFSISPHDYSDVDFIDPTHGWIVVNDRTKDHFQLFRTSDGGKNWQTSRTPDGLISVCFITPQLGWALKFRRAAAEDLFLLRTVDGGRTWSQQSSPPVVLGVSLDNPLGLAFLDAKHGWITALGNLGASLVGTSDGGKTVQELKNPSPVIQNYGGIRAFSGAGVWIFGDGFVLRSEDLGASWNNPIDSQVLNINPNLFEINSVEFVNGAGWMVGHTGQGIILASSDFGHHWKVSLAADDDMNVQSVAAWDRNHACALGAGTSRSTTMFCTEDGGARWNKREGVFNATLEQANFFQRFVMLKSGSGWALRAGGYLYHTLDGGRSWKPLDLIE
jgi:photosystem II stability/assembly factor-like uncharacterized protein